MLSVMQLLPKVLGKMDVQPSSAHIFSFDSGHCVLMFNRHANIRHFHGVPRDVSLCLLQFVRSFSCCTWLCTPSSMLMLISSLLSGADISKKKKIQNSVPFMCLSQKYIPFFILHSSISLRIASHFSQLSNTSMHHFPF